MLSTEYWNFNFFKKMKSQLLVAMFVNIVVMVGAQKQEGFISLDCGLPNEESPYSEQFNGLTYTSDSTSIETGEIGRVLDKDLNERFSKPYLTLRYFPEGKRNCYTLNVNRGTNYLVVVVFLYGNYDGLNVYPNFDLYLGPDKWTGIDMEGKHNGTREEIIHKARSNYLDICLVKTGTTLPIISGIELRPLRNNTYVTYSGSLKLVLRDHYNNSAGIIRYPDDAYDRIWFPYFDSSYTEINTSLDINNSDSAFEVPKSILKNAVVPKNGSEPLVITWKPIPFNAEVYLYMHFAEIQNLKTNETREFDVVLKGSFNQSGFIAPKLEQFTLYTAAPVQCGSEGCILQLVKTPKSTLPPLLNAIEAFTVIDFPQLETSSNDVAAMKDIKVNYRLSKISWQGDPCLPRSYSWENLRCSYSNNSTPPRIISLNLSASGLTGNIAPFFQNLTQIQELDLSNNSLTGPVPAFLASIKSLQLINLSGNNLTGSVPQTLLDREKEGLLLKLDGNPKLCRFSTCNTKKKKNFAIPVATSIISLLVVVVVVVLFFFFQKKKIPSGVSVKKFRFTYSEVQEMTNNFQRVLGTGGFGVVYHGFVNGTQQVAVKLLSQSSSQGYKHFKAEVELLMRVHHVNLVSLVGYCDEGDQHLALIYEYMPNGDLEQHLSGKRRGIALSWQSRLRIAVDAALGLEYLHSGCKPPMVHRDIKSTNILLDENFQAKIADFGLSRSFPNGSEAYVSTVVAGTPGYLDPEYYQTNWLTVKSDIYSFGVLLLEIITNLPIIDQSREKPHIVEWVGLTIRTGDIANIMDPKLHQNYDIGSAWKVIELAMSCVNHSSARRPSMSKVVNDLKDCLIYENSRAEESQVMNSEFNRVQHVY